MNYVAITPKPVIMFVIIIAIVISCGTLHNKPVVNAQPVVMAALPYIPIASPEIPNLPLKTDTIKKVKPEPADPDMALIKKGVLPPYDTLLKHVFSLQTHYLRTIDSSRSRKTRNDSLLLLVKRIASRQEVSEAKADKYYSAAQKAFFYSEQNKVYDSGLNWITYIGFAVTIICLAAQTFFLRNIRKNLNKTL